MDGLKNNVNVRCICIPNKPWIQDSSPHRDLSADFDAPERGDLQTAGDNPLGGRVYNISENGIEKMLEPSSLADRTRGAVIRTRPPSLSI